MASGVGVEDECFKTYTDQQKGRKHRAVIYQLSDDNKTIVVKECLCHHKEKSAKEEFAAFGAALQKYECAYGTYDAEYTNKDGAKQEKICFILWAPDTAPIKRKMLYASSKDALRKPLKGVACEVHAADSGDLLWEEIVEKIEKFKN